MHVIGVPWRAPVPRDPWRGIGLVGCGEITRSHLNAYRAAGLRVLALANPTRSRAEARRDEFFPGAAVFDDHRALLAHPGVEVVDVATHPDVRPPLVRDALAAGKHVLSQKPFVTDLEEGAGLCALAEEHGLRLAVNQNGRYAPHFAWIREAVRAGFIGEVRRIDLRVAWDHSWVAGTKFDETEHLILFDFGIHWFDFVASVLPERAPRAVQAWVEPAPDQRTRQPMRARARLVFEGAEVTLAFDGAGGEAPRDVTLVEGDAGLLRAEGPDLQAQRVTMETEHGRYSPILEGQWFDDGFHGTMAELLCAIEDEREPLHGARTNLRSLELAFAACASSLRDGRPVEVGETRRLPNS